VSSRANDALSGPAVPRDTWSGYRDQIFNGVQANPAGAALLLPGLFGGGVGRGLRRGKNGGGLSGDAGALEKSLFCAPHSRTAFANVKARKPSAVMWPSSTSS
jgi:hypothetical protein